MAGILYESVYMSGEKPESGAKAYLRHLKSSKDLETTYEAIRAGFVALALEKNRRATPFVAQARCNSVRSPGQSTKSRGLYGKDTCGLA